MAASQMKQSLILENPEIPLICTGYDNISHLGLYTKIAEKSGKVLFKNNQLLILQYEDETFETSKMHWYLNCYYETDEEFKTGDIIYEHISTENGNIKYGRNMLVGYMEYFGYCHEDSIVFSESAAEKFTSLAEDELIISLNMNEVLLSLDRKDYKPIPKIGDIVKKNDPVLLIKYVSSNPRFLCDSPRPITLKDDITVTDVKFYINDWCKNYSEFNHYIVSVLENSKHIHGEMIKLKDKISDSDLNNSIDAMNCDIHKFKGHINDKGVRIDGMIMKIKYTYKKYTRVGDKFSNRHGNKGVISIIVPDKKMPVTPWGQPLEVILGSLSIISRMNIGQLFELHAGLGMHFLKQKLSKKFDEDPKYAMKALAGITNHIDTSKDKWYSKEVANLIKRHGMDKKLIEDLVLIQPPFESFTKDNLDLFMDYTATKQYYPLKLQGRTIGPVAVGNMFLMKLIHTIDGKLKARTVGNYTRKTIQPASGQGAQRIGEMEVWAMIAYDAIENLKEVNIKSDDLGSKISLLRNLFNTGYAKTVEMKSEPATLQLFRYYLNSIGLNF